MEAIRSFSLFQGRLDFLKSQFETQDIMVSLKYKFWEYLVNGA